MCYSVFRENLFMNLKLLSTHNSRALVSLSLLIFIHGINLHNFERNLKCKF